MPHIWEKIVLYCYFFIRGSGSYRIPKTVLDLLAFPVGGTRSPDLYDRNELIELLAPSFKLEFATKDAELVVIVSERAEIENTVQVIEVLKGEVPEDKVIKIPALRFFNALENRKIHRTMYDEMFEFALETAPKELERKPVLKQLRREHELVTCREMILFSKKGWI